MRFGLAVVIGVAGLALAMTSCSILPGNSGDDGTEIDTYVRTLVDATGNTFASGVSAVGSNVALVGAITVAQDTNTMEVDGWFGMMDIAGTLRWLHGLAFDKEGYECSFVARTVAVTPDGGLVLGGSPHTGDGDLVVARFDSSGSMVWDRTFRGFTDDATFRFLYLHDLVVRDDGTLLMVAELDGGNTLFAELNSDGSPRWSVVVGGVYHRVEETDSGYLLIGMVNYRKDQGIPTIITHLSAAASGVPDAVLFSRNEFISSRSETNQMHDFVDSARGADGSIYAVGSSYLFSPNVVSVLVIRLSSDGALMWRKEYHVQIDGTEEFCDGNGIAVDTDGTLHVTGRIGASGSSYNQDALLLHLDCDGNVLAAMRYAEQFNTYNTSFEFLDTDLPGIAGSPDTGWLVTSIRGRDNGAAGDLELLLTDQSLNAAGMGIAIPVSDVITSNRTAEVYDPNGDVFFESHPIQEVYTDTDPTIVKQGTLTLQ